jgi:hypothetical protein
VSWKSKNLEYVELKPLKVKILGKSAQGRSSPKQPLNNTYLAKENKGVKIQFVIRSGGAHTLGTYSPIVFTFRLLVFRFL